MIRAATEADVQPIVALLLGGHKESPRWGAIAVNLPKLTEAVASGIDGGGTFVAEQDGALVGVLIGAARAYYFGDAGYASNMQFYVAPIARGGLIGVRLIRAFESWAAALGVSEIRLSIDAAINDETAIGIVRRLGYRQTCVSYSRDL